MCEKGKRKARETEKVAFSLPSEKEGKGKRGGEFLDPDAWRLFRGAHVGKFRRRRKRRENSCEIKWKIEKGTPLGRDGGAEWASLLLLLTSLSQSTLIFPCGNFSEIETVKGEKEGRESPPSSSLF